MKPWAFLNNPFLSRGGDNYKVAYELAKYTDAALNARIADPFFAALYATFHPLFVALENEYNDWKAQGGFQKGKTQTLDILLEELGFGDADLGVRSKIYDWNLEVQGVFPKGTPTYTTIFPNGVAPFQKGSKDARISAVAALSLALAPHAALAALKTTVDASLADLNTARNEQQGEISDTGTDSDEVRGAVEEAMIGMFSLYGSLIAHYAATPEDVEAFFDLEKLRNLQQKEWLVSIAPVTMKNVFKRTLANDRKVKITNLIDRDLAFYVASEKNDTSAAGSKTVAALEDEIFTWSELKQTADATYFNAANGTPDVEGHFKVEILPEGE